MDKIMRSELEALNFMQWAVSSTPSELGEEGSGFKAYGGWQTFSARIMPKNEDTQEYQLFWVPFNDTVQQNLEDADGNKIYGYTFESDTTEDKRLFGASMFCNFYHGKINETDTVEYAGLVELKTCPVIDDDTNEEIGKFVYDVEFMKDRYLAYTNSLPSRIPGLISSKSYEMDNIVNTEASNGIVPQSAQAVMANIMLEDGTPVTEPPVFEYNEKNRNELYRAMQNVTNGAKTARITFKGCLPVKMERELVLQMFLNMELWYRTRQAFATFFKLQLQAHMDDDKSTYKEFEKKYIPSETTELEPKYQAMYEAECEEIQNELAEMQESWGIEA